jgi:hypothetical protein
MLLNSVECVTRAKWAIINSHVPCIHDERPEMTTPKDTEWIQATELNTGAIAAVMFRHGLLLVALAFLNDMHVNTISTCT